jgi:hypothetical protein
VFCRFDGARLVAGKQCGCGRGMEPDDQFCGICGQKYTAPAAPKEAEPLIDATAQMASDEFKKIEAELLAKRRTIPSDVEAPVQEVS